jgi:hypothetical protein
MNKIIFVFVLLSFSITIKLFPQSCCTAGTSIFNGGERSVIPANSLSTAISFQHNVLNSTYQSTTEIEDPLNRSSTVNNFNLEIEYGLVNKVSLLVILPYTNRTRETTITNTETNLKESITFSGNGFGDIILLGKYEIITPNILSPFGFALGGGAKLPAGSFEEEKEGTRLSIDLQPGTGSADLLFWGHLTYGIPSLALSFNASMLYKYSGINLDGYRFGDELLVTLNGLYSIADFLGINFQLKGRASSRDYWNKRFLPSTGGTYFDLTPGLVYYEGDLSIRVFAQIPLYRNLQGIQLAISEMPGAEIRYNFNLE